MSYNYLSVIIDNKLIFNQFIKEKCNQINVRLYQLGKLRKYVGHDVANIMYKQTIVPLFDYADFLKCVSNFEITEQIYVVLIKAP